MVEFLLEMASNAYGIDATLRNLSVGDDIRTTPSDAVLSRTI
jgi:hypothetical protein